MKKKVVNRVAYVPERIAKLLAEADTHIEHAQRLLPGSHELRMPLLNIRTNLRNVIAELEEEA